MTATLIVTQEDFTSRLISNELSSEFPSNQIYAEPSVSRAVRRMESREIDLMLFDLQLASSASLEVMERVSTSTAMQAIFFGACSGCPADRRLIQIISCAGHISGCSSFGSAAAALDVGRGGNPVILPSVCGRFTEDREYSLAGIELALEG